MRDGLLDRPRPAPSAASLAYARAQAAAAQLGHREYRGEKVRAAWIEAMEAARACERALVREELTAIYRGDGKRVEETMTRMRLIG